eukprot:TRINITY_DN5588_c0_g1_i4.p1 TRINITY_DN5588_c0_g1~~TRINITY_DN5588_c0_g1_i4.p1  ORF type:complete len:868 (-),score=49.95 TRINITY_DN5588_c0_g1_i4:1302-3905(-)
MSLYMKHSMGDYPPRIACFVCGLEGPADYPLYVSPHGYSDQKPLPHFPFLIELVPPLGCRPPDQNSAAYSCRACYSSLMRQWDDNERGGVAIEKRVYWTKRMDGLPILDPEQQLAINRSEFSKFPVRSNIQMPAPTHVASTVPSRGSRTPDSRRNASPHTSITHWKEMGPPASTAPTLDHSQDDNDSALDLSSGSRGRETMKSCSSAMSHISAVSHHSSYVSEGAGSSTDILDLTLPDKNATTEVCYVCGDEFKRGSLNYIHTRQANKTSHYPSLVHHPRPPRSRPMDSAGRVHACEDCCQYLLVQWEKFETEKLNHTDRNYMLRKRMTPVVDTTTFVCYICALDYHSSSLRLLYCRSNSENEPYYPQVELQRPPPGASPISSGGMVQVCSHCYKCTRDKYQGYVSTGGHEPPPKKRKSSRAASVPEICGEFDQPEEDGKISPADVECPLCHRKFTVHSFKYLHSQGPPLGGIPYFPFLKHLPHMNDDNGYLCDDDTQGRVRACQTCNNSLINQWTTYQREAAPIEDRTYSYQSLVGPQSSGRITPGETRLSRATATPTSGRSLHSPGAVGSSFTSGPGPGGMMTPSNPNTPSKSQSDNVRPRSNSNTAQFGDSQGKLLCPSDQPARPHSNTIESRPRSNSNPHSPRIAGQPPTCHSPISVHSATSVDPAHKPSTSSFYCFLCGFHSELSFARMLYSHAQGKKAPYFPFMKDHVPKHRAETLREDGTALVCTFCYHSVMVQWSRYQDVRNPISPSTRKYNFNDYVCYVCGIKTYRKRIRALRVVDFPFLRHHKPAKGTITMENGDMAAVCLDCFETLKNQFVEAAKYGIPVEKRQYNWMQIPPPPEDASLHLATPKERLEKHIVSQC